MSYISGVPQYCDGAVIDPDTCEVVRDHCGSTSFTVTRELWDAEDRVVIGDAVCNACGSNWLFTRVATRAEEIELKDAPQHLVLTSEIDWP